MVGFIGRSNNTALQSQKAVTAYFYSKQLSHVGFTLKKRSSDRKAKAYWSLLWEDLSCRWCPATSHKKSPHDMTYITERPNASKGAAAVDSRKLMFIVRYCEDFSHGWRPVTDWKGLNDMTYLTVRL